MATAVNQKTMSDAELIGASRTGDPDAYAELYRRHVDAARAAGRALCRNRRDADDVVSEAFAKVLGILQSGDGPEVAFRPYLLTSVRNCFYDKTRPQREEPIGEPTEKLDLTLIDGAGSEDDTALAVAAFAALPERWQLVLWHTEVEGRSPAEVAPLLGLTPSAAAALAYRAREGVRQAFLQAHLRTPLPSDCRECAGSLAAYVGDRLSARDRRTVDEHLPGCESCKALLIELTDTNTTLRTALIPAIVGVPASAYSSGPGEKGAMAGFRRLPRHQRAGAATAAAVVVIAVVAAAVASAGGNRPTIAAPSTTHPRAVLTTEADPTTVAETNAATITIAPVVTTSPVLTGALPTTLPLIASAPPVPTVTPTQGATPTTAPVTVAATTIPAITPAAAPTVTVAPPPTIPAPTTTVPVVPHVAITSTQIGSALIGGQALVQLAISAIALPANQFLTDAFANLVVSVSLPAGVSLASADNPAWTCTNLGSCTISSIAGDTSTAVLKLAIAPTAVSPISFAPTITAPANLVVEAPPITIVAATVPGLMSQEFARGSVTAIGNTVMDCKANLCAPVDVDKDQTTFNSSTADLLITGTVARAFLVWSGDSSNALTPADRDKVQFVTPTGVLELVADGVVTGYSSSPDSSPDAFVAYMDVTGWMANPVGTFGVANIQTSSYGGWSLTVVTHDSAQPERSLIVALPLSYVTANVPSGIILPGASSSSTVDAHVVVSAFEGDEQPSIGDTVKLNGVDLTGGDAFGGRIVGAPRAPELRLNYRVDVLDANATDVGAGDVTLAFATTDDSVMIAAVGIALDLA